MAESVQEMTLTLAPKCQHQLTITFQEQGNGYILRSDQLKCKLCGQEFKVPARNGYANRLSIPVLPADAVEQVPPKSPPKTPDPPDPKNGLPGTEMLSLTAELGIESKPGCGCKSMAATMDRLGVAGSRARVNNILLEVEANYAAWGWKDKLHSATHAAWKAAGLGVNPLDPVKSLVELAIDRAEIKAAAAQQQAVAAPSQ